MKPYDQWNSADIADHARRAMHMEQIDYGEEPPRPRPIAAILALGVLGWLLIAWGIAKIWSTS